MNGMSRFAVRAACVVALAAWAMVCAVDARAADGKKPNVLFLFTDDQRADGANCLGNPVIKSPVIDSLAKRGMVFRNVSCYGSNFPAVCLPSRNMLMAGKAYFRWHGGKYAPAVAPNFP